MRSSLLLRLLGLSLAVAAFAIAATAWLTTRDTGERFRGEFERTLEADSFIFQELTTYATQHRTWDDVAPLVETLAERTGRRVVLTTPDGDVLVDSAALSGQAGAALPSNPTAEIDAASSRPFFGELTYLSDQGGSIAVDVGQASPLWPTEPVVGSVSMTTAAGLGISPLWRLSEEEFELRSRLAREAQECLSDAFGLDDVLRVTPGGEVALVGAVDTIDLSATSFVIEDISPGNSQDLPQALVDQISAWNLASHEDQWSRFPELRDCMTEELLSPSETAAEFNRRMVARQRRCFEEAGIAYTAVDTGRGLQLLLPELALGHDSDRSSVPGVSPVDAEIDSVEVRIPTGAGDEFEGLGDCEESAWAETMTEFVAEPVTLYTGGPGRFDPFFGEGWLRTSLAGTVVLLAAAGVTALAGRRLTRPIRALTAAASRMGAGDHTARVEVRGRDEVARLGSAFNSMAESIATIDSQRRAMVSDIAHELRTPLSNIAGYLEAAEDDVVPLDSELVTSLLEESELLRRLVDDLQDLALADAGMLRIHPEERSLSDLVHQTVAAQRASAEEAGVTLETTSGVSADGASRPATVRVDPARLRQALGNLVANAIRFTATGGAVRVTARLEGAWAVISVADDGPGIPPEHLSHLFDRFYRVEGSRSRETGGSGLGLAITKHLVEAHGGRVEVTSVEDEGSVFTIRLPIA